LIYGEGISVIKNYVIALMWINIATSNGYEDAKKVRDLIAGQMTAEQIAKAQQLARECIKKNYKNCVNSSLNIEKAPNKTTDKAVETIKTKGSVSADFQVGVDAYEAGDYAIAYKEFKVAAEQGDAIAQNNLGYMYQNGQGVAQDYKEVVKWYRLAGEQGYARAQNNLGYMYQNGQGVAQDYKEAAKWYRLAGEQGHAEAQFNLGGMYVKGQGVTQDYQEAVKWWRLAAEQGYASAQFNLGGMYGEGISVIQNYVIAHMWFNIAASNGYESAKKGIDIVESRMSSEQIAEAQKLARECIKKNYKDCG